MNRFDLDNSNSLVNTKSTKKDKSNAKLTTQEDSSVSYAYQNENSNNEHRDLSFYQNQQINIIKQPESIPYMRSMKSPSRKAEDSLNYSATPAHPQVSQDYIPDFYHPKTPNYTLNPSFAECKVSDYNVQDNYQSVFDEDKSSNQDEYMTDIIIEPSNRYNPFSKRFGQRAMQLDRFYNQKHGLPPVPKVQLKKCNVVSRLYLSYIMAFLSQYNEIFFSLC